MKSMQRNLLAAIATLALAVSSAAAGAFDTITQVSSYNGLLAGLYDNVATYRDLAGAGDTGIGAFERMDGEMVMLEGALFRVGFDGKVVRMDPASSTPYATLVNFKEDRRTAIEPGLGRDAVCEAIKGGFANANLPHAVLVSGTFAHIKCRSVPQQEKPYPPLAELAAHQAVFEAKAVSGTIVGFYYPPFAAALNVPGFHLHFLGDDRAFGGHVLDFTTGPGVVARVDACAKLVVIWPDTPESAKADLMQDRSAELQKVNRDK